MRLIFLLPLVLLLAACGSSQPEPTAAQVEVSEIAPTSPSISASVAAPTWTPTPTTELLPTATAKVVQTPSESTKTPAEPPQSLGEPVIVFHQEGGYAGIMKSWGIFADGTVASEGSSLCQVDPALVQDIQTAAADIGFFDTVYGPPKNICCDFFTFTLTINSEDEVNTIVISDGDPNMPQEIRELISSVQQIVDSCEKGA